MKNIIIVTNSMGIGGVERSLISLLNAFDYSEYNVDLFLLKREGELLKYIPKEVNILEEDKKYKQLATPIVKTIKDKQFDIVLGRLESKIASKLYDFRYKPKHESYVELEYSHKFTKKFMKNISEKNYDLAISYLTPHYFVDEKVNAKTKIAWIHTDYTYIDIDEKSEFKMWNKYDKIIAISESVRINFLNKFPKLKDKVIIIPNIISSNFIIEQSLEEKVKFDNKCINLLSVGRFTNPKNFTNVPDICRRLIDKGINVKWYLIGFGEDEQKIKTNIIEKNVDENVIILGKKVNPYPYIKECDIYVQPSKYEGKAVTILEAQILNKPVVITDFPTSQSQLKDGFDGVIIPLDNKQCADRLISIINNKDLQKKLVNNCKATNYENIEEIKKIYSII